jgi:hypothetical protein
VLVCVIVGVGVTLVVVVGVTVSVGVGVNVGIRPMPTHCEAGHSPSDTIFKYCVLLGMLYICNGKDDTGTFSYPMIWSPPEQTLSVPHDNTFTDVIEVPTIPNVIVAEKDIFYKYLFYFI